MRVQTPLLLIATGAVALGGVAVPGAAGAAKPRPNLKVTATAGAVHGVAGGRVGGTFAIVNAGTASAPASSARLTVSVSARSRKTVRTFAIPKLKPGARRTVSVTRVTLPARLPQRALTLRVCADVQRVVRERDEDDNCRTVGTTAVPKAPAQSPAPVSVPTPPAPAGSTPAPPAPAPSGPPVRPANTVPAHPVPYDTGDATHLTGAGSDYWVFVPGAYDATHQTPTQLFVWMHGCGGDASGDIYTISDAAQAYITLSLGGRDGGCWDVNADPSKVLAAIADVEDHFNVDQRRIVIGGYSSGGDLAYRTAFYNAYTFAGLLAENTSPFRDTGSNQQQSLAAAAWKFHVVHLAHTEDDTYPIDGVRSEIDALQAAGFPSDADRAPRRHGDGTTDTRPAAVLLPHLNDGWTAP